VHYGLAAGIREQRAKVLEGAYAAYPERFILAVPPSGNTSASLHPLVENDGENYNVAPTQLVMVLADQNDKRVVTRFKWGLIPRWAENAQSGMKMINARAETVAEKPSFRQAFRHQRCIVPANGFYEWQKTSTGKVPQLIEHRDRKPLAFAGLWALWRDPTTNEEIHSCTIITTRANATMRPLHDRMPVILPKDTWDLWLDPSVTDPVLLQSLLQPVADDALAAFPVSPLVNNVRNNSSQLVLPVLP
jgi:putative SOS response-associated peptidase YedK